MHVAPEMSTDPEASLQLLLFIDAGLSARKLIQRIHRYLKTLRAEYPFELTVVDVGEQPDLAEYYKLVATPTLIKIHPNPRESLAGSNLVEQLKNCWPNWQRSVEEYQVELSPGVSLPSSASSSTSIQSPQSPTNSIASSIELIRLSDEIFRLKQEKEELIKQLRYKDRVISMLAHDLRNPLSAASMALETLERNQHWQRNGHISELTPERKAWCFEQARTQLGSMDRMITELLEGALGASAEFKIRPDKLHLGRLCKDILAQMREKFQLQSQQVETDIPQDLPRVYGDKELVRLVFINLLDNASKYTPKGGKIQVSILERTRQQIQISVCDDGPGIPEENRDRIFEDHFRLKRDEAQEGYGLGLPQCQQIVHAHYGRIWVDTPSKGSCFHFTLPIYR